VLGVLCGAFKDEVEGAGEEATGPEGGVSQLKFP